MAKRDDKNTGPSTGAAGAGSARSRQRGKPVVVQPKRPVGAIVGAVVLAVALLGVLGFAVANQGSGFEDPIARLDSGIDGVAVADPETLSQDHVAGPVAYEQTPPVGGEHNGVPQTCSVYEEPVAPEHAVHSLEHGAVWITYNESASEEDVDALRELAEGEAYVLMSPLPEQGSPINLSAWGRRLSVDSASDARVERFVEGYANGPQTPEKGAACVGTTATGPLAGTPTAQTPVTTAPSAEVTVPPASAVPSPAAS